MSQLSTDWSTRCDKSSKSSSSGEFTTAQTPNNDGGCTALCYCVKYSFDIHKQSNRMLIFSYKNQMNVNKFSNARCIQRSAHAEGSSISHTHSSVDFTAFGFEWKWKCCASSPLYESTIDYVALNPNTAHSRTLALHYYSILFGANRVYTAQTYYFLLLLCT